MFSYMQLVRAYGNVTKLDIGTLTSRYVMQVHALHALSSAKMRASPYMYASFTSSPTIPKYTQYNNDPSFYANISYSNNNT